MTTADPLDTQSADADAVIGRAATDGSALCTADFDYQLPERLIAQRPGAAMKFKLLGSDGTARRAGRRIGVNDPVRVPGRRLARHRARSARERSPERGWCRRRDPTPFAPGQVQKTEPPRLSRRLQTLRGWSHEQEIEIFPRVPGAGRPDGLRSSGGVWVTVGGDEFDRGEDWLYGGDVAQMGASI